MQRAIVVIPVIAFAFASIVAAYPADGRSLAQVVGVHALAAASSSASDLLSLPAPELSGLPRSGVERDVARAGSGKDVDGQLIAINHRRNLAAIADSLRLIAEREASESGLGERLLIAAHALESVMEPSTEAIEKVSFRGVVSAFFFGNSRDLWLIRNAAETERNAHAELAAIRAQMSDPTSAAALDTASDALAGDIQVIERFIEARS